MIIISGLTIKIHKKNVVGFSLHLTGDDVPPEGTPVRFRVKKSPSYKIPVIELLTSIDDEGVINIDIQEEDTANLDPGNYVWNLAILYDGGDDPYTLLEPAPPFIILPEDGGR